MNSSTQCLFTSSNHRDGGWSELLVEIFAGKNFCFVPSRVDSPELARHWINCLCLSRRSYRTEVNLAAKRWIQAVSAKLENGFVLIVDYGYSARRVLQARTHSKAHYRAIRGIDGPTIRSNDREK